MPTSKRRPARRPQQRAPRPSHGARPSARDAAPPKPATRPRRIEVVSAPYLLMLNGLPKWLLPGVLAVLLVLGLFLPAPWGGILLLVITVYLVWLVALSWPLLSPTARLTRVLVIGALAVVGVLRITGRS